MKRKAIVFAAAAMLAAAIPLSNAVIASAEEQAQTEEKAFPEDEKSSGAKEGMPKEFNGEMPDMNGELPEFNGEMPQFSGEMPAGSEAMRPFGGMGKGRTGMPKKSDEDAMAEGNPTPELPPEFNGELPEIDGELPEFNGEMPPMDGEMPEFNGEMPADSEGMKPFGGMRKGGKLMPKKSDKEALAEENPVPELPQEDTED